MIKAMCWDGAGTVTQLQYTLDKIPKLFEEAFGVPAAKFMEVWEPWEARQEMNEITNTEAWQHVFADFGVAPDVNRAIEMYKATIAAVPGVLELIAQLKKDRVQVLADSECAEYEAYREEKLDFLKLFHHQCSTYLCGFLKDDVRFYEAIFRKTGLKPEEHLMIDDKPVKIAVAKQAGMQTILFKDVEQLKKGLRSLGIDC